jgi:hypothetical protein
MLRTEVDSVVTDFAADPFVLRLETGGHLGSLGSSLVGQMREGRIGGNESGGLIAGGLRIPTG